MTNAELLAMLRHVQASAADCRDDITKIAVITDKCFDKLTKPARRLHNALIALDALIWDLERKATEKEPTDG